MTENKKYKFDIISFSGRKESGKTELANICEAGGYEKKSFATALKRLVCDITGIATTEELNKYKTIPIGKCIDDNCLDIFAEQTGLKREYLKDKSDSITEKSTARDWLQVIGTDVIRAYDPDWHVRKTLESVEEGKKYVFDDTRFPNELKALNEIGAECWYIIRAKTDNISNHPSENSLSYTMFDYHVILNNSNLEDFRKKWRLYFENHDVIAKIREWAIAHLFMNNYLPIDDDTFNNFFVYSEFADFKTPINIPEKIIENETHTGFIGDKNNLFITEIWKNKYNN